MDGKVDFEYKLKICAKAFYRECKDDAGYFLKDWQEQAEQIRKDCSIDFVETCYEMNKNDAELNGNLCDA